MATETITIKTADGLEFDAYVSRPKSEPAPVVVVIQEIFGINEGMRGLADFYANAGFIAVAPDLFHRIEKNIQLSDQKPEELQRAFQLFGEFDQTLGVNDLVDTVKTVRNMKGSNGKVGTVGFCLGGKLAYMMSLRSDADADVGFYGVQIDAALDEPVKHPLLLHFAEEDSYTPPDKIQKIRSALDKNNKVEIETYPGRDHAFARVGGDNYNKEDADKAQKRTIDFFKKHL